jgi:hypothetical protein
LYVDICRIREYNPKSRRTHLTPCRDNIHTKFGAVCTRVCRNILRHFAPPPSSDGGLMVQLVTRIIESNPKVTYMLRTEAENERFYKK